MTRPDVDRAGGPSRAAGRSLDDALERYDDLAMRGEAPDPEVFAGEYPEHPELLARIVALDALRSELDVVVGELGGPPEVPARIGAYRLGEPLGLGGMGRVYAAEGPGGARYALKLLRWSSEMARARFEQEARLTAALEHPAIARVVDFGMDDGHPYIVSMLIDGPSLRQVIDRAGLPDAAEVRARTRIAAQIAEALAHAHGCGVVHRDVKPSNILLDPSGDAHLIDFGIALASAGARTRITRTGTFLGSYAYAAPEQLRGAKDAVGPWTDTYGLCATLFEALGCAPPFPATLAGRLIDVDARPRHDLRQLNPAVPRAIERSILRGLNARAKKRWPDGAALATALSRRAGR